MKQKLKIMCLIVTKNEARRRTLKKEIKIYKIVKKKENFETGKIVAFESQIMEFPYYPGETCETKLEKGEKYDGFKKETVGNPNHCFCDSVSHEKYASVEMWEPKNLRCYVKGFHGYTSRARALKPCRRNNTIIECTVPAGAKYVKDRTGVIVVDKIKIPETCHKKH